MKGERINHPVITKIAQNYNKTNVQILIRWAIEHQVSVIPKSNKRQRIIENSEVFDFNITKDDMLILDGLDEHYHVTWDPCDEK